LHAPSFYRASAYTDAVTQQIDIGNLSVLYVPAFYGDGLTCCRNFFTTR